MKWPKAGSKSLRILTTALGVSLAACGAEGGTDLPEPLGGDNNPLPSSGGEDSGGTPPESPPADEGEAEGPPSPAPPPARLQPRWAELVTGLGDASGQYVATDLQGNSIAAFIYDGPTAVEGTRLPYRGEGETYVALAKVRADGRLSWAKGFGAGEAGNGTIANTSISALAISPSGDVFIGGSLQGYNDVPAVLNLGGNPLGEGSFLAKFSADGSHQWSRNTRPGNGAEFTFSDFAVDPQGDLVALASFGPGGSQAMVIRYRGGDGEPQWTRLYGPVNDPNSSVTGRSLAVDGNGRIYWVGSFTGTVQMGTSRYTAPVTPLEDGIITSAPLVVALSNTGEVRWSRRLANHGEGLNTGVRDGHLLIGINGLVSAEPFALQGYIFDLDLSGNERWGRAVGIYARGVELGPFGEVVVAGPAPALELGVGQPPQEGAFAYVAKFRRVDGELLKVAAISAGLNDLSIGWQTGEVSAVGEFGGTSDLGFGPLKPQGESDGYLVRLSP